MKEQNAEGMPMTQIRPLTEKIDKDLLEKMPGGPESGDTVLYDVNNEPVNAAGTSDEGNGRREQPRLPVGRVAFLLVLIAAAIGGLAGYYAFLQL